MYVLLHWELFTLSKTSLIRFSHLVIVLLTKKALYSNPRTSVYVVWFCAQDFPLIIWEMSFAILYGRSFRLKLCINRTLQYFISKQTANKKVTLGILLYFLSHQMNLTAAAVHPLMAILGYGSSSKAFDYFLLFDTTVKMVNWYPLEQG